MKYYINKTNFQDFDIFQVNRLEPRSYFIPYPDRKSADSVSLRDKRYKSPKVICLNGDWDFRFYPIPDDLPDILDTDEVTFDRIDVPSCWQFRGYDRPFYVNTRYQFPFDPPNIPAADKVGKTFCIAGADYGIGPKWYSPEGEYNFIGVYRRFFDVTETAGRYVISFLGVASCADVYLNGEFAGYTEGSHNTAEFDLTGKITEGRNELVVVVHRWCNGTYLEAQDMFRNNGLFRDVLLRISNECDIWDIDLKTDRTAEGYTAEASAVLTGDAEVTFTLEGHGISVSKKVMSSDCKASAVFDGLDVTEWNAEYPTLYDLYYEVKGTCVRVRCGFRQVTIEGDVFLFNRKIVKLHGVNHHDTSCTNGYTLTPEEIERDMRLCKEYNIDTVRTSHYPPDPYLLELCDKLGIYVVDEADLETHGTYTMGMPPSYNLISRDPKWADHYVDRAKHLYQRDKLHPCITMWSLGNESGGYYCTDRMYEYIKQHSDLPVHYESAVHCRKKAYDVGSEMYPTPEQVHQVGEKTRNIKELCDRPYFLCEYAHAMGVGPGDMEKYWKEIYSYDSLFGGCVWEMADHAVLHEDGRYTYGGDHGEWEHDGNFCVDGMFYPDRSPSTGAVITKFIYRPIRIRHIAGDTFEIFNTRSFTDGDRYLLKLRWSDGCEEEMTASAGPLSKITVTFDTEKHRRAAESAGSDCFADITTVDTLSSAVVATEQIMIKERIPGEPEDSGKLRIDPGIIRIENGRPLLRIGDDLMRAGDPYTILFRAPTDNDFVFFGVKDLMRDFDGEKEKVTEVVTEDNCIRVKTRITCRKGIFTCTDTYQASSEGIVVTSRLNCGPAIGDLPRFGKAFVLDKSFAAVEYYGRCGESYADMKDQYGLKKVRCTVKDMTEPNIRPQESGNRFDTRWASISDGKRKVTFTAIDKAFELGIKPYSDRDLLGMKHREDEIRTGTYVTVSSFQQGIGTGICGPKTAPEYCYPARGEYVLKFVIRIEED